MCAVSKNPGPALVAVSSSASPSRSGRPSSCVTSRTSRSPSCPKPPAVSRPGTGATPSHRCPVRNAPSHASSRVSTRSFRSTRARATHAPSPRVSRVRWVPVSVSATASAGPGTRPARRLRCVVVTPPASTVRPVPPRAPSYHPVRRTSPDARSRQTRAVEGPSRVRQTAAYGAGCGVSCVEAAVTGSSTRTEPGDTRSTGRRRPTISKRGSTRPVSLQGDGRPLRDRAGPGWTGVHLFGGGLDHRDCVTLWVTNRFLTVRHLGIRVARCAARTYRRTPLTKSRTSMHFHNRGRFGMLAVGSLALVGLSIPVATAAEPSPDLPGHRPRRLVRAGVRGHRRRQVHRSGAVRRHRPAARAVRHRQPQDDDRPVRGADRALPHRRSTTASPCRDLTGSSTPRSPKPRAGGGDLASPPTCASASTSDDDGDDRPQPVLLPGQQRHGRQRRVAALGRHRRQDERRRRLRQPATISLADYAAAHPDATLVNEPTYDATHDARRDRPGDRWPAATDPQTNGEYFVDRVIVGKSNVDTLFDFGPNAETDRLHHRARPCDPANLQGWNHQAWTTAPTST